MSHNQGAGEQKDEKAQDGEAVRACGNEPGEQGFGPATRRTASRLPPIYWLVMIGGSVRFCNGRSVTTSSGVVPLNSVRNGPDVLRHSSRYCPAGTLGKTK